MARKSVLTLEKEPIKKVLAPKKKKESSKKSAIDDYQLHRMIQERAYELFLQRGGYHGEHERDWYTAEKEIISKMK